MRALVPLCTSFAVAVLVAAVGCNGGTDAGLGLDSPESTPSGSTASPQSACGADGAPLAKLANPSTLPACAPACGGAHCVPSDKVPESSRASFAACGGGYCLPDSLIVSGGAKPPACKSLNNADGVCLGLCVPEVGQNQDILPQASCADDERCAPCINPDDGTSTGACNIGAQIATGACASDAGAPDAAPATPPDLTCPHTGAPVLDPTTLPACGGANSGAHCLPSHLTPAELVSKLATCSGGYCVPDKLIAAGGRYIPKTCASILGAEGRCSSIVLPSVAAQATLPVATCDANERCTPCFSPLDGSDTGACKTSCDPGPKDPTPVEFTGCCGQSNVLVGKCVPRSSIPFSMTSTLQDHGCNSSMLCVPTENLTAGFVPQACHASPTFDDDYTGVCLSNCLDFGFGSSFVLDQGNCPHDHTCAPCQDNGKPTGAPGCPP